MTSTPLDGTLLEFLERNAAEHPELVAAIDGARRLTWSEYRVRARAIALALLDLGVARGDAVGLHMTNRVEHVLSDLGALLAGATPTTYYSTLAADQLAYVAGDSAATVVVTDLAHLPRWEPIRERLPKLRHLLVVGADPGVELSDGVQRFEDVVDRAERQLAERGGQVDAAAARVGPDDALTIVYTSGTTGHPKGTIVTHGGVLWVIDRVFGQLLAQRGAMSTAGWAGLSYLPLAHIAERMFSHYLALRATITITYLDDPKRLVEELPKTRPHVFLGVPRIWEKFHSALRERAAGEPNPIRRALVSSALAVAGSTGMARLRGQRPWPGARLAHPLFERLVYRRIRAGLGLDRVELALTGAAPISAEVLGFFQGLGLPIVEAYGMTETSAALAVTPLGAPRLGTVGRALEGVELRIGQDGEILARGPNITPGYLNRPEATAEAIDGEGWLHTGDLGSVDSDGYLRVTGRKKELIITAGGKNLSPNNIELAIAGRSDLIGTVFAYGDAKPYLVALITLDPLGWRDWCQARNIPVETVTEAVADSRVREEVARAVREGNDALARVEQIKNWSLLDRVWDSESGELTPTMKLKRPVVLERYQNRIDELYTSPRVE